MRDSPRIHYWHMSQHLLQLCNLQVEDLHSHEPSGFARLASWKPFLFDEVCNYFLIRHDAFQRQADYIISRHWRFFTGTLHYKRWFVWRGYNSRLLLPLNKTCRVTSALHRGPWVVGFHVFQSILRVPTYIKQIRIIHLLHADLFQLTTYGFRSYNVGEDLQV